MKRIICLAIISLPLLFIGCEKKITDTTISIYGTVLDMDTGAPLQGVLLTLMPTAKNCYTGSLGTYQFEDLQPQQYTITAQLSGYRTDRKSVKLISGESSEVTFALKKE